MNFVCPHCGSDKVIFSDEYKYGGGRFRCMNCGRDFDNIDILEKN